MQDWAVALDLRLTNWGPTSTCVAWWGESIVDLTWASSAASSRVSGWGPVPGGDFLRLPLYLDAGCWGCDGRILRGKEKKIPAVGGHDPRRGLHGGGRHSRRLVGRISDRRGRGGGSDPAEAICDSCMLRSGVPRRAGAVYWWS